MYQRKWTEKADEFLVLWNYRIRGSTGLKATGINHLLSRPKRKTGKCSFPQRPESLPDTVKKAWLDVPTFTVSVVLGKMVVVKNVIRSWHCLSVACVQVRRQQYLKKRD